MDVQTSLALAAAAFALAVFAGWRGARPPDPHRGARLIPWRFIMTLAAAVAIIALFGALQVVTAD